MAHHSFSVSDVDRMLQQSEGQPGYGNVTGTEGHTLRDHLNITNDLLMERMRTEYVRPDKKATGGVSIFTSFVTYDDCKKAITHALCSEAAYADVRRVLQGAAGAIDSVRAVLPDDLQIRVATGGGVITRYDRWIEMRLMNHPGRATGLHLITASPAFAAGTLGRDAVPRPGLRLYRGHGQR